MTKMLERWGREAVLAQEIVFSICMGAVAVLSRGNPDLVYPQVLWAFAGLLAFNLGYHFLLRRGSGWQVPLVSVAANTLLVSAVVAYSGGSESTFWPMFLLPIFTACLHLETRHALFAAVASSAFLSCFYIEEAAHGPAWMLLPLAIKAAVLIMSGGVTVQFACRERKARKDLAATRLELDRLSGAIAATDASGGRGASRRRFLEGIIYDINSQLMAIQGSAEVLAAEVPDGSELRPDIARIASSARSLRSLTSHVLSLAHSTEAHASEFPLDKILAQVKTLLDYKIKQRGLTVDLEVAHNLPRLRQDGAHLQVALLDLLLWVMDQSAPGGSVGLKAVRGGGGAELTVRCGPRAEGASSAGLAVHSHVLERDHVALSSRETAEGLELRLVFRAQDRERA